MRQKIVTLFSADPSLQETVCAAAFICGHTVNLAETPEEALKVLVGDRSGVGLFIVDLDEKVHGGSLVAALGFVGGATPMIRCTDGEPTYCSRLTVASGARCCVGKPISVQHLAAVIKRLFDNSNAGGNPVSSGGHALLKSSKGTP